MIFILFFNKKELKKKTEMIEYLKKELNLNIKNNLDLIECKHIIKNLKSNIKKHPSLINYSSFNLKKTVNNITIRKNKSCNDLKKNIFLL